MDLPKYKERISLIPGGCPQLLDFACDLTTIPRLQRYFEERSEKNGQGKMQTKLIPLVLQGDTLVDAVSATPLVNEPYVLDAKKTLLPWLKHWLPIPFLREREQEWEESGIKRVDHGPSNWARAYLVLEEQLLRIVLAFDMQVEEAAQKPQHVGALVRQESEATQSLPYAALAKEDVDAHAQFRLAWQIRDNSWFLNEPWVDGWLSSIWKENSRRKAHEDALIFEYLASYLTVLDLLNRAIKDCKVYVINPLRQTPVDVDFVLDLGNSRTTGILVETREQSVTNLNDSYLLQLRDMDQPWRITTDPFETRVEFSEVSFGSESFSRRSGRRTQAFLWPSPVRIGPEAARLSTQSIGAEGATGMSSPKRYLWDEREWKQSWRFNTKGQGEPYVTRGILAQKVNALGTPLCCMEDPRFRNNRILRSQERECAFESHFTRSSLMLFLLVEVLQQALVTINSPGQRLRRESPDVPRRLREVIFTVPGGMPLAEQRIYRRWAHWAVRVLWEALGWKAYVRSEKTHGLMLPKEFRVSPYVRCNWDEATCTQLVYIYNEISRKFQGDAQFFCELLGKRRAEYGGHPCVRLATIDVGGGTTDLSITTFELQNAEDATARMVPHPEFHDGFSLAGDDILAAIVREHVLYSLGLAFEKAGVLDVRALLAHLFGRDVIDTSAENRNRRVQFIRQVAVPVALRLLRIYEDWDLTRGSGQVALRFGQCFSKEAPMPNAEAINYVEEYLHKKYPNADFRLLDVELSVDLRRMDETVRSVLSSILENLSEVVHSYDCDALILTGRPSSWPGIVETVISQVPVPVAHIIPMSKYRVGSWYPFADALGRIEDPKTTVVVGAILCALAEGQLEGFSFDPKGLRLGSTARYIGELERTGQLKAAKVWFTVDVEAKEERTYQKTITFASPIAVGFRQLSVERWTTSRFYFLEFVNEEMRVKYEKRLPFTVTIELTVPGIEDLEMDVGHTEERDEGEFHIVEVLDCNEQPVLNALQMRLQTLPREEGFWLDTGIVYS